MGNLNNPSAHVPNRRRQDCLHQTIKCSSVALGHRRAKAPTKGLSTLNSMAFGLAVYASQCGLPQPHARLASSCWSSSTGRASHPKGSDERFQSCTLHLILLSQALLGTIDATDASLSLGELTAVKTPPQVARRRLLRLRHERGLPCGHVVADASGHHRPRFPTPRARNRSTI